MVDEQWGRAVAFDSEGRPSVFARSSAGLAKETVLTYVYWKPGTPANRRKQPMIGLTPSSFMAL